MLRDEEVAGSNPVTPTNVMSHDIGDSRTCILQVRLLSCVGPCRDGLVVLAGVDGQLAQELSGGQVDHAYLEVLDEEADVGSGVGSPDPDVPQSESS